MTSFTDDGSVVASLVNTLPPISNYTLPTDESPWFVSLPYNWYWPANYSLVAGSNISWKVKAGSAFTLIFLRGKENYDKFENLDNYEFIAKYPHIEQSQQSFVVNQTDRYFFILKATVSSVSFSTISIHIDHTRYLTEFANFNCSGSCHFQINNSDSSNACLILELPDSHISKTSYYRVAYVGYITSDFAFFLSLAIISSVCLVVFMVLCVVTVRRGKMAVEQLSCLLLLWLNRHILLEINLPNLLIPQTTIRDKALMHKSRLLHLLKHLPLLLMLAMELFFEIIEQMVLFDTTN